MSSEVCFLPATEVARRIHAKDLSARELMQATLAQIERVNPRLNAIVTLHAGQAMAQAADERQARGETLAPLHGLPVARKDLFLTRGMRTSPERVPICPAETGWSTLGVEGPMARTVEDCAPMLAVIAGPDARSPIATAEPGSLFARPLARDFKGARIAWSADLDGPSIGAAELKRTALFKRMHDFMQQYEFLVLPVNQVPPFDVSQPHVAEMNGVSMDSYIDRMKSCYFITVTGHPAISVPCGFTPEGLPVGAQIVGRHQGDFGVLQLAYAFEQTTQLWKRRPAMAI